MRTPKMENMHSLDLAHLRPKYKVLTPWNFRNIKFYIHQWVIYYVGNISGTFSTLTFNDKIPLNKINFNLKIRFNPPKNHFLPSLNRN